MDLNTSVSSSRCNPSTGTWSDHHRSAAAHDWLSSQTRSSQAKEGPPPHHRGVRLPHQRHVPVATQPQAANVRGQRRGKFQTFHRETSVVSRTCPPGWKHLNSLLFHVSLHPPYIDTADLSVCCWQMLPSEPVMLVISHLCYHSKYHEFIMKFIFLFSWFMEMISCLVPFT